MGVAGAMAAWLLPTTQRVALRVAIVAVVLLGVAAVRVFPDLPGTVEDRGGPSALAVAGVVTGIVLWFQMRGWKASATAVIVMVATASRGIGLFGAAKIGVLSKRFTPGIQVIPTVARPDGAGTATVSLKISAGGLTYRYGCPTAPTPGS